MPSAGFGTDTTPTGVPMTDACCSWLRIDHDMPTSDARARKSFFNDLFKQWIAVVRLHAYPSTRKLYSNLSIHANLVDKASITVPGSNCPRR